MISNWFSNEESSLKIPVSFLTDIDGREFSMVIDRGSDCLDSDSKSYKQQVPFECLILLEHSGSHGRVMPSSNVFNSSPLFDVTTGSSSCELVLSPVDSTAAMTVSQIEGTLLVQAKAFDSGRSYEVLSDALRLSFVGAFVLKQHQIELSAKKMTGDVIVSGTARMLASLEVSYEK